MNLNLTIATRIGLNLVALLGVAVLLYLGASVFIPVTIAVLLASVLYPGAKFLNDKLYIPWFFACLTTFISLYLLIERQMLADKVRAIFGPSGETQRRVSVALAEMAEAIRTFLVWRTIVNLGLGIVLGVVYKAAGLQYWYLWALLV